MTRPLPPLSRPLIALALLLGLPALPATASPVRAPLVLAAEPGGAPVVLAQYYAPRPPPPRYRRPHRRCWTTTQRVVQYDRWGRAFVRYVPRTVCAYR